MSSKRLPERIKDGRVRSIMKFNSKLKLKHKKKNEAFVAHFRLLGLRRGECRSNVIRSAAQAMAVSLKSSRSDFAGDNYVSDQYVGDQHTLEQVHQSADDVRRAKIAVATYRLLDPRERSDIYERVQLCYPIDRDDSDLPAAPTRKLIDQMPKVSLKIRRQPSAFINPIGQPLTEKSSEGNLTSYEESEGASTINSLNQVSSDLSLEERRSIVHLMRNSNESTLRGLSPLGWLKSRLGI